MHHKHDGGVRVYDTSLSFALNPQSREPTFPTVVPALDFDPNRDAARIETAIKTKGRTLYNKLKQTVQSCVLPLVFVTQHPGSGFWLVLGTPPSLCFGAGKCLIALCGERRSFTNEAEGNTLLPKPSYLCLSIKQTPPQPNTCSADPTAPG